MKRNLTIIASWLIALWASKVFLFSLPYKFTSHPDTQHIFGIIGRWIQEVVSVAAGDFFIAKGAYVVGSFELFTSIILLLPALLWLLSKLNLVTYHSRIRARLHCAGGLLASGVMTGAVFFHLATPLGIVVLHEGKSDGGSLFYAACSILVLGLVLFFINLKAAR